MQLRRPWNKTCDRLCGVHVRTETYEVATIGRPTLLTRFIVLECPSTFASIGAAFAGEGTDYCS